MNFENFEKFNKLALDVLHLSRNTLLVNLRFLDMALSRFEYVPCNESTYFTNGEYFIYNPQHVLKSYKNEKDAPVRDYLHIVMHCVFRHMFMSPTLNRPLWDLACDIAVENVINELNLKAVNTNRTKHQQAEINKIKSKVKILTAEKIYSYLVDELTDVEASELRGYFYADNHEIWYMTDAGVESKFGLGGDDNKSSTDNENSEGGSSENEESDTSQTEDGTGTGDGNDSNSTEQDEKNEDDNTNTIAQSSRRALAEIWKDISERMQTDLETFSKQQGDTAGGLVQNLKAVNREKYDYTAFLKKFAILGEAMKVNDDEFDYIFYTYGLKLYNKMPLIEPLEYKEVKRIKEFVIAIDTSGSVSGELVQTFVQKTYNVLKSTESFFSKINLHIIQCDAEIQEHVKITNQEEFDEYLKRMEVKGLGGTDFRPVFNLVNKLILDKEFTNLKGLVYFTDGYGVFPAQKPNYDTAFVFIDDEYNSPDVPPWAIKLVLQKDEV